MDAVVWLTYDELAARLGIERESARQQVKRKRWARQNGNDGKVRIAVPEEALSTKSEPGTEGGTDPVPEPVPHPGQGPVLEPGLSAVLSRHIERLEAQLEDALKRVADRDQIAAQRDLISAQVDALRSMLDTEKQRTEEWKAVADRFATQAENLTAAQAQRGWWPWRRRA
jgi:hypothetical protein